MILIVRFMLLVLALFGESPDNAAIKTHVWSMMDQPIEVNNVESFADAVVTVPYSLFDPTDHFDSCGIWVTFIYFNDGTLALQLERDCQDPWHSYIAVYTPTIDGLHYVEY